MQKVVYKDRTLHDAWRELYRFRPEDNGFTDLGSGSDYTAFMQLGIGALDFSMGAARDTPMYHYHSNYDSYHWMKTMIDPDFEIHATTGRFLALMAYRLADDALLPLEMDTLARNVNYMFRELVGEVKDGATQNKLGFGELGDAMRAFQRAANAFSDTTNGDGFVNDAQRLAEANRKMMGVLRMFVREEGLPGRPFLKKHVVCAEQG